MTPDLVFYTHPMSRGRTVRWMLEEVGAPYEARIVSYEQLRNGDFLALNPLGKIPVLLHGEAVISETAAICAYLADAFPEAGLAPPAGHRRRGTYLRWMFFAAGPMEAAITAKALGCDVPPERERMAGWGSMTRMLDAVESAVADRSTLDDVSFTAADLYLASALSFGMMFGTVEKRPAFERYCTGLADRPAARRARAIDDALLAADPRR